MKEVEKAESAKKKKEEKKRKEKEEGRGQEKERSQESQVSKSQTSELKSELFRTRFPHQEQLSQTEQGWVGNSQEGLGDFSAMQKELEEMSRQNAEMLGLHVLQTKAVSRSGSIEGPVTVTAVTDIGCSYSICSRSIVSD